jgi:predicted CopG family antitoxin
MATKTISITEDAYRRLASLRRGKESFSEIISRVTGKRVKLMDYFGVLSKESGEALEKHIKERRKMHIKSREKRLRRIAKELSE